MPGMVMFGRRWAIGSDDFVFPAAFELFIRVSWWIGILVLYSIHKGQLDCPGGKLLHSYLLVLLILLVAIICALSSILHISMQGTISNPGPRKSLPKLLYLRLALFLPELLWAIVGAIWVSDRSIKCDRTVMNAIFGTVIASWIIIIFTIVAVVVVFDPLGGKKTLYLTGCPNHNLESSQSDQVFYNVKKTATRVWEKRIRLLCCCIVQNDDHRVAFTSIAELFRSYFSDTDLVPSDVAAGLTLLHQEQDKVENCPKDPEEVLIQSPLSPTADDLDLEIENAAHYMKFAVATYGWPYYIMTNPFTALCKLKGDCCRNSPVEADIVGGDRLNMNFGSILKITGLQYRDFIHISFHNKIFEIPFFVALDHKKEAIVVAVRGTLSFEDILTDLSADCESLTLEDILENGLVHKGITQAANYIYRRLINDGILNQAFTIAPEYKLVVVGHSLGGGTASILAVMLKNSFPTLKCYAFSPPGGLLSKSLADYTKQFIVSVIVGKDVVPRLSMPNMEDLKRRIIRIVANCNRPKYQILLHGCWYEVFGGDPNNFPTELDGRNQDALTQPLLAEESLMVHRSPSYNALIEDESPLNSPLRYPRLFLPGRIIHIVEENSTRRWCSSDVKYHANWSKETAFGNILISPKMVTDHMPDVVAKALNSLAQESVSCISCQPQGDFSTNTV
ncbi:diacylglycerol lipase-beta isoform X1 [Eublepharis macularius]|uniref:Diacylglycerol lipase-beta n=1 Tax=Eublepharis macularius TaxID=481883 RepID=A0AA97KA88_EUBMA|nr:diacylglycerol lipase-beta isoform X1 [Eublepharis macularius]XP_054851426.1 diacylglycerol lipase-beta isoform X1 [Eublepharis macularius]XP_054851427.1 diacylglycerol lipase-beta isoform X1 [Eublepharis macularius]XP_054851428.1 diacylglycerol lipase-beta isoform X1 [Eublepharis macularius]XP_054851429.1 diacylglycerol lipase-beta isoform X1 [Eublepharis macularius]XP_054851430.1 diacylglycerol lipase-beta isoform X1 [Eublepharis macularius]